MNAAIGETKWVSSHGSRRKGGQRNGVEKHLPAQCVVAVHCRLHCRGELLKDPGVVIALVLADAYSGEILLRECSRD